MTPIADMVERMVAAGASVETILIAIRAVEVSASVRGMSADMTDIRRERDRLRKQEKRVRTKALKEAAEANDAAARPQSSADLSADTADKRCLLTSLSKEKGLQEGQENKKERLVDTRARGTRLSADMTLPDEWRQFAIEHGLDPDTAFAEFKDYWIAVPGQRGTKLNWFATWRNRVRETAKRKRGTYGQTARDQSKDKFRSALDQLREFGARSEDGGEVVRLLPAAGRG